MATKTVINTGSQPQEPQHQHQHQQPKHRGISIVIDRQETTHLLVNTKEKQLQQQLEVAPSKIVIQQKGHAEIAHRISHADDSGEFRVRESVRPSGEERANSFSFGRRAADQKPDIEKMWNGKASSIINTNGRNVLVVADNTNGINITTTTHNESNGTSSDIDNDVVMANNTRMIIKCSSQGDNDGNSGSGAGGERNGKLKHEESSRVREHSHDRQHHHNHQHEQHLAVVTVTSGDGDGVGVGKCENGQRTVGLRSCASMGDCVRTMALENISTPNRADSLTTKVKDCASAVTASRDSPYREIHNQQTDFQTPPHVVTIQVNQQQQQHDQPKELTEESTVNILRNFPGNFEESEISSRPQQRSIERQVTVVSLNSDTSAEQDTQNTIACNYKMVHKPNAMASANSNGNGNAINGNATGNGTSSSVTELNVSNNSYLYYMMTSSSGQFSPCDTLDSGTGSDLESNGNGGGGGGCGAPPTKITMSTNSTTTTLTTTPATKLEMHLKTTELRLNNGNKHKNRILHNHNEDDEHDADCDGEDSEECESTSSLSCDSLHSSEFRMRPLSSNGNAKCHAAAGPTPPPTPPSQQLASVKLFSSMLPDSLLRDIRDRKFPANDFVSKYNSHSGGEESHESASSSSSSAAGDKSPVHDYTLEVQQHVKFLQERNDTETPDRSSLPPGKTFILNTESGTFIDTKMNSMPRTYEADKFYNFHVNEHENFRSFGSKSLGVSPRLEDYAEFDVKPMQDDAFAGYKDIRCASGTSTIRSSKGTVRGVKNRVRNGIATFLQMQQPNVKNFKEKDLGKVVLYTTSMGIIRDTYAKCSNVKQILRTLLVKFEERDVFMSVEYQQEIKERMHSEIIKVPQLFVEGQHIGDAETVERLNESGELRQLLKPYKSIATIYTCQTCGGYRLLPCPSCNGSKKSVHRNHFTAEFVALKCMNCDEVGLVKCHNC